jgi:hypothetical protein
LLNYVGHRGDSLRDRCQTGWWEQTQEEVGTEICLRLQLPESHGEHISFKRWTLVVMYGSQVATGVVGGHWNSLWPGTQWGRFWRLMDCTLRRGLGWMCVSWAVARPVGSPTASALTAQPRGIAPTAPRCAKHDDAERGSDGNWRNG